MMDTALAASALNLDAPNQSKSGTKSDTADGTGKKHAFADALKQQGAGKHPNSKHAADQAGEAADTLSPEGTALPVEEEIPSVSGTKKPLLLLSQALARTTATPTAGQVKPNEKLQGRIDIRHGADAVKEAAKGEGDSDIIGSTDETILPDGSKVAVDVVAKGEIKIARTGRHGARSGAAEGAEVAAGADAPAKDALGILDNSATLNVPAGTRPANAVNGEIQDGAGEEHGASGGGRSYRVSRADGKGGVLEIPGHVSGKDEQDAPAASASQVTVLDQRRYLAPAQDNALSVINTIAGDPEWSSAMQPDSSLANAAALAGGGKVVNTLKIQMHPIDLGPVTATMRLAGEALTVELKVETGAAYRQLKDDQSRIIEALKSQGFSVDQVTITMASSNADASGNPPGSQTNGQQQNGQGAAFAQQQARDGGQGAGPDRQRRGVQQEISGNGTVGSDDGRIDTGSVRGTGRSGDVYL